MAITFSVDFSGTVDETDKRAALLIIENENTRRAADLDENGDPLLPPLPYSTGAELKASYLSMLAEIVSSAHASYREQFDRKELETARTLWNQATDAERAAAIAALGG